MQNKSQTYSFNNIRYAQPPVGDLRFAAPVPPAGRNPVLQNGSFSPICPQALPAWSSIGNAFVRAFAAGNASSFNYTAAVVALSAASANTTSYQPSPQETEDCLFLDVVVPKKIFDNANNLRKRQAGTGGAPVLVWHVFCSFSRHSTNICAGSMVAAT
jgi:carboxylesterase type B